MKFKGIMIFFKNKKGMTLIEAVINISVFTLTVAVLFSAIIYFYRTNQYNVDQAFAIEEARKGIEFMVRDIREAGYSDEGSYPIISADLNSFYFYSDIDRDSNIERVKFYLEGTSFKKEVTKSSGNPLTYNSDPIISVISNNIRNEEQGVGIFSYFDSEGNLITDFSDVTGISFIKVNLIVNADNNRNPDEFTLRSSATLRNLKDNF